MQTPTTYSFPRYLSAKKTVDDRALNQPVWARMGQRMADLATGLAPAPLRVLEIGAGIGTMVERLLAAHLLRHVEYTALDAEAENVREASVRLPTWARQQGFALNHTPTSPLHITSADTDLTLWLTAIDLFHFLDHATDRQKYDLLIAHAFLDLVDIPRTLPRLHNLLKPGGLGYFTIIFDGATILQPEIDPPFDAAIEALYHATMDTRLVNGQPSGDSRSGRHMFGHLPAAGFEILAAGSSDWVVFPTSQGYVEDEAYFLHFIVQTMYSALIDHADLADRVRFTEWIAQRHQQIEQHELVYIAHQLDFLVSA